MTIKKPKQKIEIPCSNKKPLDLAVKVNKALEMNCDQFLLRVKELI